MDPNLHLALLVATRDDQDDLLQQGHSRLQAESIGEEVLYGSVVWNRQLSDKAYQDLSDTDADARSIHSLEGIDAFGEGLEVLDLAESAVSDTQPLAALTNLKALRLGVTPDANLDPLLGLRSLERLALAGAVGDHAESILAAIAKRGVVIDESSVDLRELSKPFADINLKLAVVNHVHQDKLPDSFPQFDEYQLDTANLARVLALPISPSDLNRIEDLRWDEGGLKIHHLVYRQWSGEDSTFALRSLAGIEHLPNLRRLACYTKEIPAAEVDALVARDVLVFDTPFPTPEVDKHPDLDAALLYALQFATHWRQDFPRNFWSWDPKRRCDYLERMKLGSRMRSRNNKVTLSWNPAQVDGEYGVSPPTLLAGPGYPLDRLVIRRLQGLVLGGKGIEVLDLPLSELSDLSALQELKDLQEVDIRVTPSADLTALTPCLVTLRLGGELTSDQRSVLNKLKGRVSVLEV